MKSFPAVAVTALLLLLAPPGVRAQEPAQIERRLQSVATLIETSSAARQIESSGDAAARAKRDTARLVHREAVAAFGGGDLAASARLLDQAAREMMQGARLARPDQVNGEKKKQDFEARLESARALLAAQQRIVKEKGAGKEAQEVARSIEAQIADAQKLAGAGRDDDARALLDRAYVTARVSIESLRRGDTLVRSLNFANKREEYDYEIDRNDTHRMLIKVLLSDRREAAGLMQPFVDKAAVLRGEAEARAKGGDHDSAVKSLEDSTRELVRAIRAGGLYIPG
jgi:hypothetical protein